MIDKESAYMAHHKRIIYFSIDFVLTRYLGDSFSNPSCIYSIGNVRIRNNILYTRCLRD